MTAISIDIGRGITARTTGEVPGQPAMGFTKVDDAMTWQLAQLSWDPSRTATNPRAGTAAVKDAAGAIKLLHVDGSLRLQQKLPTGGSIHTSVSGWNSASGGEVLAVMDGMGQRLVQGGSVPDGKVVKPRAGQPPLVALDGRPLQVAEQVTGTPLPGPVRSGMQLSTKLMIGGAAALVVGGAAAALVLARD